MKRIPSCKRFTGYKPCRPDRNCWDEGCVDPIPTGVQILIVNLDAMGDVLMTTAQLPGLKRKFPESTIHWITLPVAAPLLANNPLVDRVYPYTFESLSILRAMKYDYAMNVDKSQRSGAIMEEVVANRKLGFGMNEEGKIYPFNEGAHYNFRLGMDDELKFKINQRTGEDYLAETFENDYQNDEYVFELTDEERAFAADYRRSAGIGADEYVVGFNTGCSTLFPNKKMRVDQHQTLIERLLGYGDMKIILLGGPEDERRNLEIAAPFGDRVVNTPTNEGVRRGACYESLADVVVTGDSFGMHLAVALKKHVIAWFGLSCWTEIELFGRGVKLHPEGLACAPCWKKVCPHNLECIDMIDLERIEREIRAHKEGRD
ncbi:MAG: lipopolysaccharide heptosyltransferase family protein [Ignavibacteriales bacterium]|nr:lipopolysaccharide heptosyltransferase family protein [Ignavibacteriales bacterium]